MKKRHLILLALQPILSSLSSQLTSLLIVRACCVLLTLACLTFPALLPTAHAAGDTIYRIKMERGNTLFIDYPRAGAEALELPVAKVINVPSTSPTSISSTPKQAVTTLVRITSPKPEELMIVPSGETICRLELAKPLENGASVRVWLDGHIHASATAASLGASGGASLRLNGLNPGQHSLRADIFDARGKTLFTTKTRVFYVMRKLPRLR